MTMSVSYGDNLDYQKQCHLPQQQQLSQYRQLQLSSKSRLDPESFSDYYITNIYLQNGDWPGTNIEYWRKRTTGYVPNAPYGQDGRWRWGFHDLDGTLGFYYDDVTYNTLELATEANGPDYPNPAWATLILRKLLENPSYKNDFINRFADLMNTTFLPSRAVALIDEMKAVVEPNLPEHIARWKSPASMDDEEYSVNFEKTFVTERPAAQRDHIRAKFGIASNINATLDVSNNNHGYIKINTINIKEGTDGIASNPYPWTGVYFSKHSYNLKSDCQSWFCFQPLDRRFLKYQC